MTWEVLCKCSGKYIDIYFNLKITCVFVCFFCVVGYPPNWGKQPRYIDR